MEADIICAYTQTWSQDGGAYNALTKRSLEHIEAEAAKMWLGGTNGGTRNSNWGDQVADRSIGTTFVNDSGFHRLVVASIFIDTTTGLTGATETKATAEVGTDLSTAVDYTPGAVSKVADSTDRNRHLPLAFIVNPGEEYRIVDDSEGGSVSAAAADGAHWYEFDFSAVHTAQTYATGDQPATSKLNTYANAVNDAIQAQDNYTYNQLDGTLGTTETVPSQATLVSLELNVGDDLNAGEARIRQQDSGGSMTTVARLSRDDSGGFVIQSFPLMVNPDGSYVAENVSGSAAANTYSEAQLALPSSITFTQGESGSTTGDKWRDLDKNAAGGWNTDLDLNRVDAGTGTGARTPSSSHLAIVLVHVRLDPSGGTADAEISVGAESETDVASAEAIAPSGTNPSERILLFATNPGESWSITSDTDRFTVLQRTEWVVQT